MPKQITNNLPRDASTGIIQEANDFVTVDATPVSPQKSPFTATGGVDTITLPTNAAELILYPVTHDLKVSEDIGMGSYDLVTKTNKETFPCVGMSQIYIQGTIGDTIYFRIHEV